MQENFDVIIAGGGFSGVNTALKIRHARPDWKIAVVEKEARLGGRLVHALPEENLWDTGLSSISEGLLSYFENNSKCLVAGFDLNKFRSPSRCSLGALAAGSISVWKREENLSPTAARAIAGAAAARDWSLVDELISLVQEKKRQEQSLAQVWKGTRKSPSAIALEHLASCWGIPDIWTTTSEVLVDKAQEYSDSHINGEWGEAARQILHQVNENQTLNIHLSTRILGAQTTEQGWQLSTTTGKLRGSRLIVAQSPWDALLWLPKDYWPEHLLNLTMKSKPSSAVIISDSIATPPKEPLPDVIVVPAESCQIIVDQQKSICFQATLNYELTVQAPAVVKAIKRLKRAKKKLLSAAPGLELKGDHIALIPVAWTHILSSTDRRLANKISQKNIQTQKLYFCGESYGNSTAGDDNLIESINTTLASIVESQTASLG